MKFIKYLLYVLGGLVALYIVLCLLGPKKLSVSEKVDVQASPAVVFNLVNNLKNTSLWNHWSKVDTTMKTTYNDIPEGNGAISEWVSENQGSGKQTIVDSEPYKKVRSQMEFKGWDGVSYAEFDLADRGSHVETTWSFEGAPIPLLVRGMMLITRTNNVLKKAYKNGLAELKTLAEARSNENLYLGYTIKEEELDEKNFIIKRQNVEFQNIQQFYVSNLGQLFSKVQQSGVEMAGMPCGLFFSMPSMDEAVDMAAAIPVSVPISVEGASSYRITSKPGLVVDHYGEYSGLQGVHDAVSAFMKDRGYFWDPPFIEEYVTDPGQENNPDKVLTRVVYYFTQ